MKLILISSDSKTLLDNKLSEIIKENQNKITYQMKDSTIRDIIEEASYVSMFEEEKYIVVKNADFFGKEKLNEKETELLQNYFEHPYEHTTLIFTTYEPIDQRKTITKKIQEAGNVYHITAPKNYELIEEIKRRLKKYKIEDQTVRYIVDACLGVYDIIINEISKLEFIFEKGSSLSLEQIKKIIVPNVSDNVFKFVDAVVMKDSYTAFHLLQDFESSKIDSFQILNLLAREYRLIFYYKLYEQKGYSLSQIGKELNLRDWQVEKIRKESSNIHKDDLKDFLVELGKIDVATKNGSYEKNLALKSFLMKVLEY